VWATTPPRLTARVNPTIYGSGGPIRRLEGVRGKDWGFFMGYNDMGELEKKAGVVCPFCGSDRTELFSLFGQQLLTVQYYCNSCHTPFERVKDDDVLDDYAARKESDA
jgi:DNA-directed RNA polymerase subunit RPC12/RpoP